MCTEMMADIVSYTPIGTKNIVCNESSIMGSKSDYDRRTRTDRNIQC